MHPAQYIAAFAEPTRSALVTIDALIQKTVPDFTPYVAGRMIGYGKYRYRYDSGREGESCRIGLASGKTGISIYVSAVDANGWIAEQAKARLGKVSVGKSCIRLKKLSDLELDTFVALLEKARALPAPGEVTGPSAKTAAKTSAGVAPEKRATKKRAAKKQAAAKKMAAPRKSAAIQRRA